MKAHILRTIGLPVFYTISISICFAESNATAPLLGFNSSSLFGRADQNIDLSHFSVANFVAPGKYLVNLSINGQSIGLRDIEFEQLASNDSAVLCVNEPLLLDIDLEKKILTSLPKKKCITIKDISSDAYYTFDSSELTLDISIPLALKVNRPRGYIAPERFNAGVTAAFLRYDYNAYHNNRRNLNNSESKSDRFKGFRSQYLSLDGGMNLGVWSFRHRGSFQSSGENLGAYRSSQNDLSTDILKFRSRLNLGEFSTNSYYISSLPLIGVQLKSDQQMLPWSQRSYSPVIESFAYTNALVNVYQNGQKIYEQTVPAGAFKITDLNAASTRGDLTVEITETGGDKRSFIIPLQSNTNLVRVGMFNYNAAVGKYKFYNQHAEDWIGQASFEYGLNNNMSIHAGTNLSSPFQGFLFGLATNTPIGGINLTVENSNTSLKHADYTGQSYQLGYRYAFQPVAIQFSANAKHQTREYITVNNAMSLHNYERLSEDEYNDFNRTFMMKNQYSMGLNQTFSNKDWGSLYFNVMQYEYWNDSEKYNQFSLGYSNRWNKVSYSLGASRSEYKDENSNQVYLSLSVPLDFRKQKLFLNSTLQHNDQSNSSTVASASISGTAGENRQTNFGVSASQSSGQGNNSTSVSGNIRHRLPQLSLSSTVSRNDYSTQYSYAARGAVVAHRYGVTLVNELSDTYTIIHVPQGQGATVENSFGTKIDRFGNGIYPYSSPYQVNQIAIDPAALALNINLKENKQEVIPRQNSATLVKFKAETSSLILLTIQNAQNRFVMGTPVLNARGETIGSISQSNEIIIESEKRLTKQLKIMWGRTEDQSCLIELTGQQMDFSKLSQHSFNIMPVECK